MDSRVRAKRTRLHIKQRELIEWRKDNPCQIVLPMGELSCHCYPETLPRLECRVLNIINAELNKGYALIVTLEFQALLGPLLAFNPDAPYEIKCVQWRNIAQALRFRQLAFN